jgi:hypothetical protein
MDEPSRAQVLLRRLRCIPQLSPRKRKCMTDTDTIRTLNDTFRRTFHGGRVLITAGVQSLGEKAVREILSAVSVFDDFTEDNDPYGEHDFGSLRFGAEKIFWKIDYYDREMAYASPDAADPCVTVRILTIMLASEY